MKYRILGKTGLNVSEIGFGAWGIGGAMWQGVEDRQSIEAVNRALDLGVNFFDTALVYGDGHSENLIGKIKKERGEEMIIATKVPPKNLKWPAPDGLSVKDVFPKNHIIDCTNQSLKNLCMDHIDIQQFHVWSDEWAGADEIWETVAQLKKEGKIRAFGISINDHQPGNALKAAATGHIDAFQVIYNIFDQSPEDALFPYCIGHNIGIIVRVPLDEGGLTGKITPETTFPEKDWRNRYFGGSRKREVFDRANLLKPLLGSEAKTLPELALRYVLDHPAVSTAIPGMRSAGHAASNVAVSDGRRLSAWMHEQLKNHRWVRNYYSA